MLSFLCSTNRQPYRFSLILMQETFILFHYRSILNPLSLSLFHTEFHFVIELQTIASAGINLCRINKGKNKLTQAQSWFYYLIWINPFKSSTIDRYFARQQDVHMPRTDASIVIILHTHRRAHTHTSIHIKAQMKIQQIAFTLNTLWNCENCSMVGKLENFPELEVFQQNKLAHRCSNRIE